MERKEGIVFAITLISFIGFIYVFSGLILDISAVSPDKITSLTGNSVVNLDNNFNINQKLAGNIITSSLKDKAGLIFLSKENKILAIETFNFKDNINNQIRIEDLIDYSFTSQGKYELFVFSQDINVKKEILIQ